MMILIYRYGNICEPDIIRTFQEFGTQVEEICEEITEKKMTASRRVELVHNAIENCRPAMVFSINFFPAIAEVCHIHGLLYCCWTVDAPVPELYSQAITYDTNRIFLFDRSQYLEFREFQPDYTFHLPLAAAVERFDQVLGGEKKDPLADSRYDISFVGSLYSEKNPLASMELPEYERGYVDALSEAAAFVYGYDLIGNTLSDRCVKTIREKAPDFYAPENVMADSERYVAVNSYVGIQAAERERILTLNRLAEHFRVDLFTGSDTAPLNGVNTHGTVKTLIQMPWIFRNSKINLNMTIKPIRTGLPLRIFDILGCGGFCMTNYQEELEDLFRIGTDLEAYGSPEELEEKCAYYLTHEEERQRIAANGYRKAAESHTYRIRMAEMLRKILE